MAGFSGVVYALGNRAGRELDDWEKSGVLHMLLPSLGTVIISLVAITLLNSNLSNPVAWRIISAIAGIFVIGGASKSTLDMLQDKTNLSKIVAWPTNISGEIFGVINILVALGLFLEYAEWVCVSTLIFLLFASMISFAYLLMERHSVP